MELERLKRALIKADQAGNTQDARAIARAIKAHADYNQMRLDQASDPSMDVKKISGDIIPISRFQRNNGEFVGNPFFDSDAGLLGFAKQAFTLPKDVYTGKVPIRDQDGNVTDEVIGRSFEFASMATPSAVGTKAVKKALPAISKYGEPETAARVKRAGDFGIDLSKGQGTRNLKMQADEQAILAGTKGQNAQNILQKQRETQMGQVDDALVSIKERLAPGQGDNVVDAGGQVRDAVVSQAAKLKKEASGLFDKVNASNAEISSGLIPKVVQDIDNRLIEQFGRDNLDRMPAVNSAMKEIQALMNNGGIQSGIPWKRVQSIRSRMTNNISFNTPEGAALTAMRKTLDDNLDDYVMSGLVSGSKQTLADLKKARSLWASYKSIVKSPNTAIRKISDNSLDGAQVANLVVGASQVGNRQAGASIVREIKKIIGKDHSAMAELKRGVLTRLFNDVASGETKTYGKLASDINRFTAKDAPELAKELFGVEGLRELRKLSAVIRDLTPDKVATNPSNSGFQMGRMVNDALRGVNSAVLGYAATGDILGALAGLGLRSARERVATKQARELAAPPVRQVLRNARTIGSRADLPALKGTGLVLTTGE